MGLSRFVASRISLLPVFMVSSLGATAFAVGIVEGVAEATALIVKVFSGVFSDRIGRRKSLAVIGYGLGALSKPLFALALTVNWVLAARFIDWPGAYHNLCDGSNCRH